ncbi:MAG: SH3 domain-containing protein [Candidatus Cloacimonetes bacterium]|nr:SH3 domain-containing protein [Candidatus Cloacimonadota bacterium]
MKKYFFLFFVLITSFLYANLSDSVLRYSADDYVRRGIQEYQLNNFERALDNFLLAENTGLSNADLFYNLGNTYFRLNNIPNSIIYYKRALLKNSSHKDARKNLDFVLSVTRDRQLELEKNFLTAFLTAAFYFLSINTLFVICLILLGLIVLSIHFQWAFINLDKTVLRFINFVLLFLLLSLSGVTVSRIHLVRNNNEAVITANSVHVYSGPNESFTRLFTIHEGTVLRIQREEAGWTQITALGALSGWINSDTYRRVVDR